ncbi:protein of unknown function [Mesonia phycicola]|uniref:DUF4625 domain-containing protein n=1 Tax=Mesonia phycicola TaxID=579105 RepID=A0A1M6FA18_9FLAO|nr:DUF4625 domain-containing protein [Mesonia phycicola]SHI94598.1 protein of unknown function [Mesonia phycicola]
MKLKIKYFVLLLCAISILSCSSDDGIEKDEEKPTITINYEDGFPQACTELVKGETYTFKALVTDNQALASYSLDVHHNFDHHTHDDQGEECELEEKKEAVNPLIYMENVSLEEAYTTYEITFTVEIPTDIDAGDYHCSYSVTDETGWQARTSIDIKIIE